jgi:hypothetical protein
MEMHYKAPPMPVHLTLRSSADAGAQAASSPPPELPPLGHEDLPAAGSLDQARGLKAARAAAALFGTELSPFGSQVEEP